MKHTPSAISIEMATHTDVYSVRPQYSNKRKFLEECAMDGKVDRSNIYSNF